MPEPAEQSAFLTRNTVQDLPHGALQEALEAAAAAGRPLRVKLGLDPTAPDLHLGHTVVLQKLREFQDLGHRVVLIVGDCTARVGDPSGRSQTRPPLTGAQIDENAATYQDQAFRVLREDSELIEVRRNSEWLDLRMEELFALARTTTVAQLLERNDFAQRFAARTPISILELLYPLLQGYDSVAIDADVEVGGTDQTFNLMLGRDVQRAYGSPQQCVLTLPILPGVDGVEKMSKSLGNHIGVTDAPAQMLGRTLSLPDAAMDEWVRLLAVGMPDGGSPRDRKRALAHALVARFHGTGAADAAQAGFDRQFVEHQVPTDIRQTPVAAGPGGTLHLPAVIADAFGRSRSDARRLLADGAVRLGGEVVRCTDVPAADADGRVLQVGRRAFTQLRTAEDTPQAPGDPSG